ncbi:MAG TPA: hypothetical protein VIK35_03035 [Verrucomicrobiae bacterium]
MKFRAVQWLLLLAFGLLLTVVSGCMTEEAGNDSQRPWDAPQGWENGMPLINNQQHSQ